MADPKYQIDTHLRVYDNENGAYLTVRPSADFPDTNVMILADKDQEEYFGAIRLDCGAEYMRKLGEALIRCADDMLRQEAV